MSCHADLIVFRELAGCERADDSGRRSCRMPVTTARRASRRPIRRPWRLEECGSIPERSEAASSEAASSEAAGHTGRPKERRSTERRPSSTSRTEGVGSCSVKSYRRDAPENVLCGNCWDGKLIVRRLSYRLY